MFGWNRDRNMSMIRHQMPFYHLAFFLRRQVSEYLSQVFPQFFKYSLFAILQNPHDVILAFLHCNRKWPVIKPRQHVIFMHSLINLNLQGIVPENLGVYTLFGRQGV